MAAHRSLYRLIPALFALAAPAGCDEGTEDTGDTGFFVAGSKPPDEDQNVVESIEPELRLSGTASESTCTPDTVLLRVVSEDNTITEAIDYDLSFEDGGNKIVIQPQDSLLAGYWYLYTVRSGAGGCTNTDGVAIQPFSSLFFVP